MPDHLPDSGLTLDELATAIRSAGRYRATHLPQQPDDVASSRPLITRVTATAHLADGRHVDLDITGEDGCGMLGRLDVSEILTGGPFGREPSGHRVLTLALQGQVTGRATVRPAEESTDA